VQQQDSTRTASGAKPVSRDGAPAAEEHITLAQAAKLAPGRPSSNCVWRWCCHGVKAARFSSRLPMTAATGRRSSLCPRARFSQIAISRPGGSIGRSCSMIRSIGAESSSFASPRPTSHPSRISLAIHSVKRRKPRWTRSHSSSNDAAARRPAAKPTSLPRSVNLPGRTLRQAWSLRPAAGPSGF